MDIFRKKLDPPHTVQCLMRRSRKNDIFICKNTMKTINDFSLSLETYVSASAARKNEFSHKHKKLIIKTIFIINTSLKSKSKSKSKCN